MKERISRYVEEVCMITTGNVIILALGEHSNDYLELITSPNFFVKILLASFLIALITQLFQLIHAKSILQELCLCIAHIMCILLFVLMYGHVCHWFDGTSAEVWVSLGIEIILIYIAIRYITYRNYSKEAKALNEQLRHYKAKHRHFK